MAGKQGKYDPPPPVESPLDDRFTKTRSHSSYRSVVRVFSDQICHPGHDAECGYVFTGFLIFLKKKIKNQKKTLLLVACAEVPISSIGTWKARHHRKRIRSRGSGDTPSSVIPLFTRKEYLFMWASLHVGGQSTCLMTSWSRSPAHVRDATGLVPSTTSCSCSQHRHH